jgi:2,3-bisphosphoglycerate-dependent phosphoglycerate mutase
VRTAEGICERPQDNAVDVGSRVAPASVTVAVAVTATPLLQEQDFGSREGVAFGKPVPLTTGENIPRPEETRASMRARTNTFLLQYLIPALLGDGHAAAAAADEEDDDRAIAVVAHGVILRVLWSCLVDALSPIDVDYGGTPGVAAVGPHWSNTGYMELSIRLGRRAAAGISATKGSIAILCMNNTTHLQGLRRIGGGIGSSVYDARQRTMESYFSVKREK